MEIHRITYFLFCLVCACTSAKGVIQQTLTHCCDHGKNYANSDSDCASVKIIPGVDKKDEANCLISIRLCCKTQAKENECRYGLNDAKNGNCNSPQGTERQQCCEACQLGKLLMQSGNCDNIYGLGAPYDKHFKTCCEELFPKKNKSDNTAVEQPRLDNICEIEGLCAQICIPTKNSHRCDCHPGYILMQDGISCKEVKKPLSAKKGNGCDNSPCEHNCVDTGVAIFCTCNAGFVLGPDKRSCDDIDECALGQHECLENETCSNVEGFYDCISEIDEDEDLSYDKVCEAGYRFNGELQTCEDINECDILLICPPSHTCNNTEGSYDCLQGDFTCPPGFQYKNSVEECVDIDECVTGQNDCNKDSQICLNNKGNYTCVDKASKTNCPPGFKMNPRLQKCDDIDECLEQFATCSKDEICVNEPGGHTCKPKSSERPVQKPPIKPTAKYTTPRPKITPKPYNTSNVPSTRLLCNRGFRYNVQSKECEDINECQVDPKICDQHHDCLNTIGSYVCNCKIGFTKDRTTMACVDINECLLDTNDCIEGQRCDNTIGSFVCSRVAGCGTGYTLNFATGLCEDDDECFLGTHTCDKLGTNMVCRNTKGSYRCEKLPPKLPPPRPTTVRPLPDPRPIFTPPYRKPNFTIITYQSKQCLPGYYMDSGGQCRDIDECISNPCGRAEKCINLNGRYECVAKFLCKGGFELNEAGDACVDINECARGTHSCSPTQICKNDIGFHVCLCPPGHQVINSECVDINECEFSKDRICSRNSYCVNTLGSYECKCKEGFREHGASCVDIDECSTIPNLCEQKCVNVWGGYRCSCERGFQLNPDNRTCTDVNECERFADRGLCVGMCENTPGSYQCRCPPGYKIGTDGRTCQDIDECETQHPCRGTDQICYNIRGGYECPSIVCPENYKRDPDHKSRCKKDPYKCAFGNCGDTPDQYTYHFFNIVSELPLTMGPIKFFQMKGPSYERSKARFNLKVENVRAPNYVKQVDQSYFRVNRETRKADISFVQSMQGPQQIELSFEMQLFNNDIYTGKVVAKIFIYVSEHSF